MTKVPLFFILICCTLAQRPCTSFLNDESGCISTLYYSCKNYFQFRFLESIIKFLLNIHFTIHWMQYIP